MGLKHLSLKSILVLQTVLILFDTYGQHIPTSPNAEDENGRQGRWAIYYDEKWEVIEDTVGIAFYSIINYKDDKPVGLVRDYFRNGQIQMEAHLLSDRPLVFDGLAKFYTKKGDLEDVQFHRGSRTIEESINEIMQDREAESTLSGVLAMANLYYEIRSPKARPLYLKYLKQIGEISGENSLSYARALRSLAWDYLRHSDFINAEPLFFQSKIIIDKHQREDPYLYVHIRNDIADYYSHIGRYGEALKYFQEAQALANKYISKDDYLNFIIMQNMASCYRAMDDFDKAVELSTTAVEDAIARFGKFHRETANTTRNLAFAFRGLGDYDKYESLLWEVLAVYDSLYERNNNEYLSTLNLIGDVHFSSGDIEKASEIYEKVYLEFLNMYGDLHLSTINSNRDRAFALYRHGRKDDAIQILIETERNNQKYLHQYFDNMNEQSRMTMFARQQYYRHIQSSLAVREKSQYPELVSELLNMQLYNKALLITTSNAIKKRILESNDRKLVELYHEIQDLRQTLGRLNEFSEGQNLEEKRAIRDSLTEIFEVKDRELNRMSAIYSASDALPDWRSIPDKLQKNEALVEIHSYKEFDFDEWKLTSKMKYIALIVSAKTKESPALIELADGDFLEKEAIKAYTNKIRFKINDEESYDHFWKPLERHLKKFSKIYFSSDGVYHKMNPQTLINSSTGRFLMNEKNIQLITSGRDLIEKKREASLVKLGMLLGNPSFGEVPEGASGTGRGVELLSSGNERSGIAPLPGAEKEVMAIAELLEESDWKSIVLTNEEAEESALKDMLKPNILHIATHGFFAENQRDERNPLRNTGLLFTGAAKTLLSPNVKSTGEDGVLTSFEALNLNIDNTNLVVLSACETGLGELKNGEGIYGLQRAFKIAGARTIIMSLWKVDDEATNKLMTQFYRNWLSNSMSKREAFFAAQSQLMKEYKHPYYWGAFVVLGE